MVRYLAIGQTIHPSGLLKKGPAFFSGRPPPCDNLFCSLWISKKSLWLCFDFVRRIDSVKSERRVNGFRFMLEFLFCTAAGHHAAQLSVPVWVFFRVLSGFGFILLIFVWLWFFFDALSGSQNLVADFAACKFWHLCHISYKFGLIRHFRFGLSLCYAFGNVFTSLLQNPLSE